MQRLHQLFFFALAGLVVATPANANTFKFATLAPAGTAWMVEMKTAARVIREKTAERVKFKFYPGGVMGSEQTVHRKIKAGQLHGGAFSSAGLSHLYPDVQSMNLAMLFDTLEEVDYVRAKLVPEMTTRLAARDFELLGTAEVGFTHIMSKIPIPDYEAIQTSKLWAPQGDSMVQETYRSMGLSPVSLPISDVFTGLQTGLVETITSTPSAAIAFQWHSGTSYLTTTPVAYLFGLFAMQKSAFDKIDPADQIVVRDEIDKAMREIDRLTRADNHSATEALRNQGIRFVEPLIEDVEHLRQMAEESIEHLINRGALTRRGIELVQSHLRDYRSAAGSPKLTASDN